MLAYGARLQGLRGIVEAEIVPRLMLGKAEAARPTVGTAERIPFTAAQVDALSNLLLTGDQDGAIRFVERLVAQGHALDAIYLDLLAPTARHLGELWEQDAVSFVEVTLAMGVLRQTMRVFQPAFLDDGERPTPDPRRRALLATVPGCQHTLGVQMVAEFLRRDGWDVTVESPGSCDDLSAHVRHRWYALVGLSAGNEAELERLSSCVRSVRGGSNNRGVAVIVGGQMFRRQPDLAGALGADASAGDGAQAAMLAERLFVTGEQKR